MIKKLTLEQRLTQLERIIKEAAVTNATPIYQDRKWKVYRVTDYTTAKTLGRGTDWGISGKWDSDTYRINGVWSGEEYFDKIVSKMDGGLYFYIRSGAKYCLAVRANGKPAWIMDDEGSDVKPKDILLVEKDFPSIEGVFVPKAPAAKAVNATALVNAAAKGDTAKVTKLLAKGADPDGPDKDGATPLMVAFAQGQYEVAKVLLDAGVDPNGKSAKRAMGSAVGRQKIKHDSRFVDLLVEYGSTLPQVW